MPGFIVVVVDVVSYLSDSPASVTLMPVQLSDASPRFIYTRYIRLVEPRRLSYSQPTCVPYDSVAQVSRLKYFH